MSGKRQGIYILGRVFLWGLRNCQGCVPKTPNSQVGSCIVSQDNKILSMGYNGFPMGCSDDEFPLGQRRRRI